MSDWSLITGPVRRRSLYDSSRGWHGVHAMTALRDLRRTADLSQQELAALLDVPLNTLRMWDSGLRLTPAHHLRRAALAVADHYRNAELVSLDQLARELGVHQRTLRAAARTGRLQVTFSSRSVFGRPVRLATRTAARAFMRKDYRRYSGQSRAVAPLPSVPDDYAERLRQLRRRLHHRAISHAGLAPRTRPWCAVAGVAPAHTVPCLLATSAGAERDWPRHTPRPHVPESSGAAVGSPPGRWSRTATPDR